MGTVARASLFAFAAVVGAAACSAFAGSDPDTPPSPAEAGANDGAVDVDANETDAGVDPGAGRACDVTSTWGTPSPYSLGIADVRSVRLRNEARRAVGVRNSTKGSRPATWNSRITDSRSVGRSSRTIRHFSPLFRRLQRHRRQRRSGDGRRQRSPRMLPRGQRAAAGRKAPTLRQSAGRRDAEAQPAARVDRAQRVVDHRRARGWPQRPGRAWRAAGAVIPRPGTVWGQTKT